MTRIAWFWYKWGQLNCVTMFWCHILRIKFLLPSFKPEFFFSNFKFEFYNLIRLSYLIFCCKRTKSWTSSLRKSVLILTRSDFEEVNVVTCWDKKMWFVSLNSCVQKWPKRAKGLLFAFSKCDLVARNRFSTFVRKM